MTGQPSRYRIVLIFVLTFLLLGACATPQVQTRTDLFWPLPPDPPKISYVMSLTEPKDLGERKGFFRRAIEFILGKEEPPKLIQPHAIYSDGQGKVYITDTGLQVVHVFDFEKKTYRQVFKLPFSRLLSPVGVAVDGKGRLYVSDSQINRILVFDAKGKFLRVIGQPGDFVRVAGITLSPFNNLLYVVDSGGHKVLAFDLEGQKKFEFGQRGGGEGYFNFPTHIAVDQRGQVYVSDSLNFRIQVFNPDGQFVTKFGQVGNTIGTFSKPKGVAVDQEGHIYVVDGLYDTVQVFNEQGELLIHFGNSGVEEGQFWLPAGVFADAKDRIYVADTYNHRVQVFKYLGGPASGLAQAVPQALPEHGGRGASEDSASERNRSGPTSEVGPGSGGIGGSASGEPHGPPQINAEENK